MEGKAMKSQLSSSSSFMPEAAGVLSSGLLTSWDEVSCLLEAVSWADLEQDIARSRGEGSQGGRAEVIVEESGGDEDLGLDDGPEERADADEGQARPFGFAG